MNKQELIKKIRSITEITNDEQSYLIDLINNKKKYGLVWEDKPEDVEQQLLSMLPVFTEVKERAIISEDKDAPNHILIEGDNLHALTALTYTHEGKIDVIYIDPPYNTGNKDFIYNDSYIDKEDSYRHSKWLSFMEKKLKIAHKLISEQGVIFISVDDNEQANLTLLMNDIFGQSNQISILPTIMNLKGNQDQFGFAGTHEYTLVYSKNRSLFKPNQLPYDSDELDTWQEDEIGLYKKETPMRATGTEANRNDRPNMFYPILIKNNTITTIDENDYNHIYNKEKKLFNDNHVAFITEKYENDGFEVVWPKIDKNTHGRWRWGYNYRNIEKLKTDGIIIRSRNNISLYKKQRPEVGNIPTRKPKSLFYKPEYSSGNGTRQLSEILGGKYFDNPKPIDLLIDILIIASTSNSSIILDFFAGSGTALHATMELNKEDGGNRQCILVTNNENNIAEEVTYERNKRVIEGYTNLKGENIEGLKNNNLRYFKADFVPSERTERNRRLLTARSTELLCVKEDCYLDITIENDINSTEAKIFTNGLGKFMVVVYHSRNYLDVVEQLSEIIDGLEIFEKVRVYAFSTEKELVEDDFYKVIDKIEAVPLPDSIYNAYRATFQTLKLDKQDPIEQNLQIEE